jgi:deoxyribodipyrimidine photo-lyase
MRVIIWFHRDLRTHDHTGLNWALQHGYEIFAVVFSPSASSSPQKLKFWNETSLDLAKNLKTAGISLVISHESPLQKLPELVASHKIEKIITHKRMNFRDQKELKEVISNISVEIQEMGDLTLYDAERSKELSLKLLRPFTGFKNYVTANWKVPELLHRPWEIDFISETDSNWSRGGEIAGINRIRDYIWKTNSCRHYHETRNGMIERDDSSKFSRWLTWGAVSPRFIYHELKKAEEQMGPSKGVSALIYELIWRDYFKFLAQILGEAFFSKQGLKSAPVTFKTDTGLFEFWKVGETGEDFVDANMRELLLTGWMSNRGRQNVASYLAKTLQIDWTLGASWFEQQLIDVKQVVMK